MYCVGRWGEKLLQLTSADNLFLDTGRAGRTRPFLRTAEFLKPWLVWRRFLKACQTIDIWPAIGQKVEPSGPQFLLVFLLPTKWFGYPFWPTAMMFQSILTEKCEFSNGLVDRKLCVCAQCWEQPPTRWQANLTFEVCKRVYFDCGLQEVPSLQEASPCLVRWCRVCLTILILVFTFMAIWCRAHYVFGLSSCQRLIVCLSFRLRVYCSCEPCTVVWVDTGVRSLFVCCATKFEECKIIGPEARWRSGF